MNPVTWVIPLAVSTLLAGCASRSVPARFPETSPASSSAPEGGRASVTRALDEDPPLPGSSTDGWPGLAPTSDPAPTGHEHHHGHTNESPAPADHPGHVNPPAESPSGAPDAGRPSSAASYTCPMHPDVVSDREGRCSRCGMALERRP